MATALTRSERLSNALNRAREKVEHTTQQSVQAVITVGGGLAAGWLEAKKPTIGPSNLQSTTVVGGGLLAAGLLGLGKKHSDHLVSAGAGILAAGFKDEAKAYFLQH